MRGAVQRKQRWPKGAFPEKYRWDAVERRLAGAWDDARRAEVLAIALGLGLEPRADFDDPYVRLLARGDGAPVDLRALREAIVDREVVAVEWLPPERDDARAGVALVASADPVDALVAIGTAGPQRGIGTAAVVRFVLAVRALAAVSIEALGEDRMRLAIAPRPAETGREEPARVIAERVLQLCQGMARAGTTADELEARMARDGTLELDWL